MLKGKTVAVVVPAYNEEKQISMVIETMPDFVDRIVIVNDCSRDQTAKVVESFLRSSGNEICIPLFRFKSTVDNRYDRAIQIMNEVLQREDSLFTPAEVVNTTPDTDRIILINHLKNGGVGAAIATGYKWCRDHAIDCTAVMAGDGQMDPAELKDICWPVLTEEIDYVKGNRLIHPSARLLIPPLRFLGNSVLSILTKIASGYWHVSDTQTGYTAISLKALQAIQLYNIYHSYGMPNDMLVKLNINFCTLREIMIKPVYNVGECSKMKIGKVIPRISFLLICSFFKRLYKKYLLVDFHPLFLLYHLAFLMLLCSIPYGVKIGLAFLRHSEIGVLPVLAFVFLFFNGMNALFFSMWLDMQDNERLNK